MTSSDTLLQRLVFQYLHLSAASTWKPSGQSDLNLLENESGKAMAKDCKNYVLRMWSGGWVYKQFSWSCHVEVWTQLLCRCSRPGVFSRLLWVSMPTWCFLQRDRRTEKRLAAVGWWTWQVHGMPPSGPGFMVLLLHTNYMSRPLSPPSVPALPCNEVCMIAYCDHRHQQ